MYGKELSYLDKATLTNVTRYECGWLEVFIDDKECLYVFDRGY